MALTTKEGTGFWGLKSTLLPALAFLWTRPVYPSYPLFCEPSLYSICKTKVQLPEIPTPFFAYSHARQECNAAAYPFALSDYTLKIAPLQTKDLFSVTPKPFVHPLDLKYLENHNVYAMHSVQRGCLQTQYQSDLAQLQNRSVLDCLLMRIVSGKDYALHCLFALHCLKFGLSVLHLQGHLQYNTQ